MVAFNDAIKILSNSPSTVIYEKVELKYLNRAVAETLPRPVRVNSLALRSYGNALRKLQFALKTGRAKDVSSKVADFTPQKLCPVALKMLNDFIKGLELDLRFLEEEVEKLKRGLKRRGVNLNDVFDPVELSKGFSVFVKRLGKSLLGHLNPVARIASLMVELYSKTKSAGVGGLYVDDALMADMEKVMGAFELITSSYQELKEVLLTYAKIKELRNVMKNFERFGEFLEDFTETLTVLLNDLKGRLATEFKELKEFCRKLKTNA